jgi:iron complex outermembrane receptor protein
MSQQCDLNIKGFVLDSGTEEPLEAVSIVIQENELTAVTDNSGSFHFEGVCEGAYHVVFYHLGCEPFETHIHLQGDTTIKIEMDHSVHLIESVVIHGNYEPQSHQKEEHIHEQEIDDKASENLSEVLSSVNGVALIKSGGITKPVVNGLYGNRLLILNNEIAQAGQQWGNDHSPEIDPLSANIIRVIKGSASAAYLGANAGNVIIIEPQKIDREAHIHGKSIYFYESNGRANNFHTQLQQYTSQLAWRITATAKKKGDLHSPTYYLNNTGSEELNLSLQLEKDFKDKWLNTLYLSTFNTKLGVLRGAHIGNLTDLESAFTRTEPFFTEDQFSYAIDAPKQDVHHHLLKYKTKWIIDSSQYIQFIAAAQLNVRDEFDIRRIQRTDIPAMSLRQYSFYNEAKYQKKWANLKFKSGIQLNSIDNTNIPGTGVLPLIPDYLSNQLGSYIIFNKKIGTHFIEFGTRGDYTYQSVPTISRDLPRRIIRYDNHFLTGSTSLLWKKNIGDHISISSGSAFATRNPAINELYSQGLHQGVSGIEEGNSELITESVIKGNISSAIRLNKTLYLNSTFYSQNFQNYVYLQPQKEVRLTIRGAFPLFKYEQTDAQIFGADLGLVYEVHNNLKSELKYSYIKGLDISNNISLINIPSNQLNGDILYERSKFLKVGNKKIHRLQFKWLNKYVFQQSDITADQDFVLPPDAYYLMGIKLSGEIQIAQQRWRVVLKGENLLNSSYRDYLNRIRYFSNAPGRNLSIGLILKF